LKYSEKELESSLVKAQCLQKELDDKIAAMSETVGERDTEVKRMSE